MRSKWIILLLLSSCATVPSHDQSFHEFTVGVHRSYLHPFWWIFGNWELSITEEAGYREYSGNSNPKGKPEGLVRVFKSHCESLGGELGTVNDPVEEASYSRCAKSQGNILFFMTTHNKCKRECPYYHYRVYEPTGDQKAFVKALSGRGIAATQEAMDQANRTLKSMQKTERQLQAESLPNQIARVQMIRDSLPGTFPKGTSVCSKGNMRGRVENVSQWSLKILLDSGKTIWDHYTNWRSC